MLDVVGLSSLDALTAKAIPKSIRMKRPLQLGDGMAEKEVPNISIILLYIQTINISIILLYIPTINITYILCNMCDPLFMM